MATKSNASSNPSDNGRAFWSAKQLAEHWGCSVNKVRLLIYAGDLKTLNIGRLVRISDAERARFETQNSAAV
ncbi:MAG: hypothetical protein RIT81_42840 [Deltaproteobacteria bacterium]